MARITLPQVEGTNFERAMGWIPETKSLYDQLYKQLWDSPLVSQKIKEKILLYLANVNGCMTCMSLSYTGDDSLNEEMKHAVKMNDFSSSVWSDFDRLLFSFIKQYRTCPKTITTESIKQLNEYLSDEQLLELLAVIQLFDGFHKMIVSLDLYDFCMLS